MPGRRVSRETSARSGRAADLDLTEEPEAADEETSRLPAPAAAQAAAAVIAELMGKQPEGVTALEPTDDGWRAAVEVLEDQRVPSSADILATYQVELGPKGELLSYRRTRRYQRGRADASEGA
jgi:hypothetical protein